MSRFSINLSSASIAGCASLALKDRLDRLKLTPSLILGCGGSALVAAMWACGFSYDDILKASIKLHNDESVLKPNKLGRFVFYSSMISKNSKANDALFSDVVYRKHLDDIFGDREMTDTEIELVLQCTELLRGSAVSIKEGRLADVVYASNAMLPFMPAIEIKNQWLLSGNFSNPAPLMMAVNDQVDYIINLNLTVSHKSEKRSFMQSYAEFINDSTRAAVKHQAMLATDLHAGEISFWQCELDDYEHRTQIIEHGIKKVEQYIDERHDELRHGLGLG